MRDKLAKALQVLLESQKVDGGWRYTMMREGESDTLVTLNVVFTLRVAIKAGFAVPEEVLQKAVAFIESNSVIDSSGTPDGTFYYKRGGSVGSPAIAACGNIAIHGTGRFDHPLVLASRDCIQHYYERYSTADIAQGEYPHYRTFYTSIAMYQAGDDYWVPYYRKLTKLWKETQQSDGQFFNHSGDYVYPTACAAIVMQAPLGYFPFYYRSFHPPIPFEVRLKDSHMKPLRRICNRFRRRLRRATLRLGLFKLAVCLIGVLRLLLPLAHIEYPHKTQIALIPPKHGWSVAGGDPFTVRAGIEGVIPDELELWHRSEGNRRWIKEYVRPEVTHVKTTLVSPDYSEVPPEIIESGQLSGLEGTRAYIRFTSSKDLRRVTYQLHGRADRPTRQEKRRRVLVVPRQARPARRPIRRVLRPRRGPESRGPGRYRVGALSNLGAAARGVSGRRVARRQDTRRRGANRVPEPEIRIPRRRLLAGRFGSAEGLAPAARADAGRARRRGPLCPCAAGAVEHVEGGDRRERPPRRVDVPAPGGR